LAWKKLDGAVFEELKELENKQKINPIGEFGEYHTFVLDCPIYRKKINILDSENIWENAKGYTLIKDACLQPKTS
jgi:diphthamide synthase (EF-2-diphthine--ammonia ligase)